MKFFKRFYNPFKPHVCKLNTGNYAVRKFKTLTGWHYLSTKSADQKWWFMEGYVLTYCQLMSKEEAQARLYAHNKSKSTVKNNLKFSERVT